ncbi:hypothetical protein [Thermoflavimicrobium daqui]|jgi:hypothetical protein|uniref:hypothetical protein n=1 Tax=Thermoflavimicrobium daqui TaxID=2137476 RepID=UPI00143DEF0A|nr:hypothetical protein [Thermoflavimicrobium daqui]
MLSIFISEQPLMVALAFLLGHSAWYVFVLWIIGLKLIRRLAQRFQYYLDIILGRDS